MDFGLFFKMLIQIFVVIYGTILFFWLFRTIRDRDKISFYSNCLIEAINAKLENPDVKITVVTKGNRGVPHFLWSDGKYDYDFGTDKKLSRLQTLWFKGRIHKRALGFNEEYKRMSRYRYENNCERVASVYVELPSGEVRCYVNGDTFRTTTSREYIISDIRIDENEVAIYGYEESTDNTTMLLGRFIGEPLLITWYRESD